MMVNALIIGAGRSGTTTVYEYLNMHKEVCFSTVKEVHFFSIDDLYKRGTKYYNSFFKNYQSKKVTVSADTYLFIDENAIQRVYEYNPNMKFIVMLRNPVDRAFSGYCYAINNGYLKENVSFLQSIEKETELLQNSTIELKNNLCNLYQSQYFKHLTNWTKVFPLENFLILKTSDLKKSYKEVLSKISRFLNISDFEVEIEIKANSAKTVKSKNLEQILLNRDLLLRKVLRTITPGFLKNIVFKTGVIDQIHRMNKSNSEIKKISNDDRIKVEKYLQEDLKQLKSFYNISFDEN